MTQSPAGQGTASPLSGDPGTQEAPRFAYGGQALMEGVYMRGKDAIGVAVRGPDGQIFAGQEPLNSVLHRRRFARAPLFRGVVVLYETLVIGTKWLMRSGSLAAAGEGVAFGGGFQVAEGEVGRVEGARVLAQHHAEGSHAAGPHHVRERAGLGAAFDLTFVHGA